jgi:hypothetical protein
MGKITLEFDTNEEAEDIRTALDGYKYKLVLWDLDQHLRAEVKYNDKLSPEVYECYDKLREKMREFLFDYNISIE